MNVIFTVLFAFALGYVLRERSLAMAVYLALDAIVFAYQTLGVLLDWLSDNPPTAFGPAPTSLPVEYSQSEMWGYGVINLVIIGFGIGLVALGHRVRARRVAKRDVVRVA